MVILEIKTLPSSGLSSLLIGTQMNCKTILVVVTMFLVLSGCSNLSSSTAIAPIGPAWEGPILISQEAIPINVEYKVIGSVQANARVGYDSVTSLYPLLAAEARRMGANAVVNAKGGRRVSAFSWSAAYVSGTAIKVEDPQTLKGLSGTYH